MKIIDLHTHVFPDRIAPAAVAKLRDASHTRAFLDGTAAQLQASMKRAGIGRSVVLPVATSARQVPHINDAAIARHRSAPETGIDSFGGMHPDFEDWEKELERLRDAGIRGVKLHPPYQGPDFDDGRFLRILKKAAALSLAVLTHAGLDVGLPGERQATPEKIRRAIDRVPDVTLILAHMGGWRCWEETEKLLAGTPVYLDTSFALGTLTPSGDGFFDAAPEEMNMLSGEQFVHLTRVFGADRVLFGTDSPWMDQKEYLARFLALPLREEEKRQILGENAEKLLKF